MANYVYIDNYSKKGKVGISISVFDSLVAQALNNVPGIAQSAKQMKKNQKVRLNRPVQTTIHHGIVHVWVAVDVVKGNNLQDVSQSIQNEIANTLMVATEQVPFDVQVKVVSII